MCCKCSMTNMGISCSSNPTWKFQTVRHPAHYTTNFPSQSQDCAYRHDTRSSGLFVPWVWWGPDSHVSQDLISADFQPKHVCDQYISYFHAGGPWSAHKEGVHPSDPSSALPNHCCRIQGMALACTWPCFCVAKCIPLHWITLASFWFDIMVKVVILLFLTPSTGSSDVRSVSKKQEYFSLTCYTVEGTMFL